MYSKMRCIKQTTKFYNDPFLSFFTWPSVQGYASLPSFESYEEFPVPLWCYNSVHSLVLVSLRLCPQGRLFARRQRVAHWSVAWLQGCSTWHRAQPIGKRVDLGRIGSLGTTGSPSASGMWTAPDGPPALCPPPPPPPLCWWMANLAHSASALATGLCLVSVCHADATSHPVTGCAAPVRSVCTAASALPMCHQHYLGGWRSMVCVAVWKQP